MGDSSDRADRFVQKMFNRTPSPIVQAEKQAEQTRAQKLVSIAQRAIERRKGF